MKVITRLLILFAVLLVSQSSIAEGGCPPGMYPPNPANTAVCYPFPDSQKQPEAAQPKGYWKTRYAAIATGKAAIGVSTDKPSKRSAENSAMSQCKAQGSKNCKITASYYNQCAVVAWGTKGYEVWTGPDLNRITKGAMSACSESYEDCQVYYSNCVEPVWINQ